MNCQVDRKERREAFTLIEVVTALTILSAIFATLVLTIYVMQKSSLGLTDGMDATVQQQRLAMQLRGDAHQAQSVAVHKEAENRPAHELQLVMSDGQTVKYQMSAAGIHRQTLSGEKVVHREFYAVAPVLDEGWTVDTDRSSPMVVLHLDRDAGIGPQVNPTLVPLRLVAALQTSQLTDAAEAASSTP